MAGFSDVATILDYRTLGEVYSDASRTSVAANPLFDFYTSGTPRNYDTDNVEFVKLSRINDPAPTNLRSNPARMLQPTGKDKRQLTMLNMFNAMSMTGETLMMLRHPEQWTLQQYAREELAQQLEDFGTKHRLTKQVFVAMSLANATIYVDENGDLTTSQPSSGDRNYSISTGLSANNLSQIAKTNFGMGSGNIIDVSWDDPAAKILDHLDLICEAAEYQGSEKPRHVWLHSTNKIWIRANDQILEAYGLNKESSAPRLDNELRGDTFEINNYVFHFYGGTYTDISGSTAYFVPKTQAIITPDVGPWVAYGHGRQWVPTTFEPGSFDTPGAWNEVYGDFSYAVHQHNPPSVELYMGSNFLFGFKNPNSIFAPTVDF